MWIGWGVGLTAIAASAKVLVATYSAGALALRPFTILRTRGIVQYVSDQNAVNEEPFGFLGSIVVSETAAALGVTAIPDPSGTDGDPEAAWFNYQTCVAQTKFLSAVGFESDAGVQYIMDSKAMRKVGADDNLAIMFSQVAAVGATVFTGGRQLIQLH